MKSRPVLIVFSILAGLDVLFAGAGLGDIIGVKAVALGILATKTVQVGMSFYVQNAVVPVQDVSAYINSEGVQLAGPAAGVTNGTPVEVSQTPPNTTPGMEAY